METSDIFLFTLLVVPAFIFFMVVTIREFNRAGSADYKHDSDTRFK